VLAVRVEGDAEMAFATVTARLLETGLAKGKLPEEIVVWNVPLPRNPSGKVVRSEVAAGAAGRPRQLAPRLAAAPASDG
jgi:acyl-coenzyme A synthetase/AMP-(fatty) acid ligase